MGFLDNFVVIGSADDVLATAVDGKKAPLSKSSEFTLDAKVLPQQDTGVGFFSIPRIIDVVKGSLPTTQLTSFQKDVEPALTNFKAISLAGGVPTEGVQSSVIFIHVAEQGAWQPEIRTPFSIENGVLAFDHGQRFQSGDFAGDARAVNDVDDPVHIFIGQRRFLGQPGHAPGAHGDTVTLHLLAQF